MNALKNICIISTNLGRRMVLGIEIRRGLLSPGHPRRGARARSPLSACLIAGIIVTLSGTDVRAGFVKGSITEFKWGKDTREGIRGTDVIGPGGMVVATFTLQNGKTFESPAEINSSNHFRIPVPTDVKPQSTVTLTDDEKETATYQLAAQLFNPPGNVVVTSHSVLAGSTVTVAGSSFALSGSFVAVDTNLDNNPSSPTYGDVSAHVSASGFNVAGTGPLGTFSLALNGDQPYTLNLLPVWNAPDDGISIPINLPFSGTATLGSIVSPVSGNGSGSITFLDDGIEDVTMDLSLTSTLGPITGTLVTVGVEQLVPEPSSVVMLGVGMLGVLSFAWFRRTRATRLVDRRR